MYLYRFLRVFFRILFNLTARWKVIGAENMPTQGAVIMVSNHASNWDPVLVACAVNRYVSYMSKEEMFKIPVLKHILPLLGVFPIKRGKTDIAALRTSFGILNNGGVLGMFPEGTRSKTGDMASFKTGIAMLIYKAHCPIVPVALINSKKVLSGWLVPVKVVVGEAFLPPLPEGKATLEDLEKITLSIEDKVRSLIMKNKS